MPAETQLDSRSNSVTLVGEGDERHVRKTYRDPKSDFKLFKYRLLSMFGGEMPVEYRSGRQRREFECESLKLWRERGFRVPEYREPKDGADVALEISYLQGPTLDEHLRSDADLAEKWRAIDAVLADLRERHCIALYEEDWRLIHFDSNMRNIVLTAGGPARIDFEMGRSNEKINRSAAREVNKLVLEIGNALGREHFAELIERAFAGYGIIHILRLIAEAELERAFAGMHQKRDARKKEKRPGLVTKVDLAQAIEDWFAGPAETGRDAKTDQAEATSWDGKFYQSFDDSDRRGRDMPHRYGVMQFPESFEGQSILDIGCNLGRCCIDAARRGARRSVGVDFRPDVMEAVTQYCLKQDIKAEFHPFDINDGLAGLQAKIGKEKFDYVCVLSIWSHVDKPKLWEIINEMTAQTVLFEDNSPSRVKSLEKMESILRENLNFPKIEFLGFATDRGVRAVFRLSRESI